MTSDAYVSNRILVESKLGPHSTITNDSIQTCNDNERSITLNLCVGYRAVSCSANWLKSSVVERVVGSVVFCGQVFDLVLYCHGDRLLLCKFGCWGSIFYPCIIWDYVVFRKHLIPDRTRNQ